MDPAARKAGLANAWVEKALGWGTGELELGQTEEPKELIHGDASKLRSNASQLRGLAKGLAAVGEGLRKLNSHEIKGETADAFRKRVSAEPKKWFQIAHACEQASGALTDVAHTVEWAQRQAGEAIDTYGRGKRASERAREAHNAKVDAYNKAVDAYNSKPSSNDTECAAPPKAPGTFHDPGAADMEMAREILAEARRQREAAHDRAQTKIKATYDEDQGSCSRAQYTGLNFVEEIKNSEQFEKYREIQEGASKGSKVFGIWKGIQASKALWGQWKNGIKAADALARPGWFATKMAEIADSSSRLAGAASRVSSGMSVAEVISKRLVPLSVATGLRQAISPDHDGAWGWGDRTAGGLQAAGGAAVLAGETVAINAGLATGVAAAVPVAGWAVLGATGAYFLGSYVYEKWGDDIAAGAKTAWNASSHAVTNAVGGAVDATVNAALHPSGAVKAAEHVVDGTVNSVKKLKFW
ncbi:putative T7SS-secreted protein [Streptomyces sp. NPDC094472]|uniref:putative T7SS-secreted protein n=1 Tax=Streptomyces sp. NPDC094472 TaxID=3155080 RepID=UPI00332DC26C